MSKLNPCALFRRLFAEKVVRRASLVVAVFLGVAMLSQSGVQIAQADEVVTASHAPEELSPMAPVEASPAPDESSTADSSTEGGFAEPADSSELEPPVQDSGSAADSATANDEDGQQHKVEMPTSTNLRSSGFASLKSLQHTSTNQKSPSLEPVKFQGIVVGQSTRQALLEEWGDPADTVITAEGNVLAFDVDPFQAVEVLVGDDNVVAAIKIALEAPLDPEQLAEQLSLSDIRAVTARDDEDEPLGLAFPERGVIFMYDAPNAAMAGAVGESTAAVSHVVLQRLDPLAFSMRAESALHGEYTQNIDDLKTAIRLDPHCAHANSLLARVYLTTGQADLAAEAARAACEADPENAACQLLLGRALELQGSYDDAVLTVRAVLDRENLAPLDKSQALHQMGYLASLGDMEIASKAIGFHTRAIEIADTLATSTVSKERRAAKQILVEAHLAVGEEVARQAFNEKVDNLSQWIGRASGIAEEFINHDDGNVELRLLVAQRALAALASFRPTLDPGPWVEEADAAAQAMLAESDDDLWQARVNWELGLAYLNALRVEHVRRETQSATQYGNKAFDYLAQGAKTRQAVHSSEQQIGLLYFQMGAVQAVHQLDHAKAAKWYDKAEPLLTAPLPKSELFTPRREGEMLVSMGVTYWQLGDKQRALTLTQNGVGLVEAAVEAGILARTTLGVPYGNLATMYEKLGEESNAAKYSELAKGVAGVSAPQRVDQTPGIRQATNTSRKNARATRPTSLR